MQSVPITLLLLISINPLIEILCIPINDEKIKELITNDIENMINIDEIDLSHLDGSIFGKPDNQTTASRLLEYYNSNDKTVNPEELGTYLEGDMLIPKSLGRNGLISQSFRWPNATVPYKIDGTFTPDELSKLNHGFDEYHKKTCIKFIPYTTESDYISIVNGNSGCWSSIGKIGGRQEVNLQTPACLARGSGTFIHELMHAVGFLHEQNRYERDDFIIINYENINKESLDNFAKASAKTVSGFGIPYDYGSIMHYSPHAFSINGKPTIIAKFEASSMGQRIAFSNGDIAKINLMYQCNKDLNLQNASIATANNSGNNNINNNNNKPSVTSSFLQLLGLCGFLMC